MPSRRDGPQLDPVAVCRGNLPGTNNYRGIVHGWVSRYSMRTGHDSQRHTAMRRTVGDLTQYGVEFDAIINTAVAGHGSPVGYIAHRQTMTRG